MASVLMLFAVAAIALIFSIRSFMGKERFLSNAYQKAAQEQRQAMNKKACLQTGFVFLGLGLMAVLNALKMLLQKSWLLYISLGILAVTVIYWILSEQTLKKQIIDQK